MSLTGVQNVSKSKRSEANLAAVADVEINQMKYI
jgi:hypothetical protein